MSSKKNPKSENSQKKETAPASGATSDRPIRLGPGLPQGFERFETLVAALVILAAIVILYPGHIFQDKIFFAGDNQAAASFTAAAQKAMEEDDVYPVWYNDTHLVFSSRRAERPSLEEWNVWMAKVLE